MTNDNKQQDVREAFEAHQLSRYQYADITRDADGRYCNVPMESEWETWQAALQSPSVANEGWKLVPVENLKRIFMLIDPPPIETDGKTMVFNNPRAAETLTKISAEVRALLDAQPPQQQERKQYTEDDCKLSPETKQFIADRLIRPQQEQSGEAELRWVIGGEVYGRPTATDALEYANERLAELGEFDCCASDSRVPTLTNVVRLVSPESQAAPQPVAQDDSREEDAYVIERLSHLLAEIAIILKGPELPLHRHGYQDLPDLVRALKAQDDSELVEVCNKALSCEYALSLNSEQIKLFNAGVAAMHDALASHIAKKARG